MSITRRLKISSKVATRLQLSTSCIRWHQSVVAVPVWCRKSSHCSRAGHKIHNKIKSHRNQLYSNIECHLSATGHLLLTILISDPRKCFINGKSTTPVLRSDSNQQRPLDGRELWQLLSFCVQLFGLEFLMDGEFEIIDVPPQILSGWWFQIFFIFTPIWGRFPI